MLSLINEDLANYLGNDRSIYIRPALPLISWITLDHLRLLW